MDNLSHWMYAYDFSARQAAYLIKGIDPSSIDSGDLSARHIEKRIADAYLKALRYTNTLDGLSDDFDSASCDQDKADPIHTFLSTDMLFSSALEARLVCFRSGERVSSKKRSISRFDTYIHSQKFVPAVLAKWLHDNKLPSVYDFGQSTLDPIIDESKNARAAQFVSSTENVRLLFEAWQRCWSLFDPSDPSTAPTNEFVVKYSMERGMPQRLAEVGATMLRDKNLKKGRRPYKTED